MEIVGRSQILSLLGKLGKFSPCMCMYTLCLSTSQKMILNFAFLFFSFSFSFLFFFFLGGGGVRVELFFDSCEEMKSWIQEKDAILSDGDVGRDLETVRALQRRHQVSQ